jgi:hypothetical protein
MSGGKERPDPGTERAEPKHVDTKDDMYDLPQELNGSELLPRALRILNKICEPYWDANHEAMRLQTWHRWITRFAVAGGSAAVVLAIVQLPNWGPLETWKIEELPHWEGLIALIAIVCVALGIIVAVQKKWLLERHKAEQFRFLKYHSLLSLVTNPADDRDLKHWARKAEITAKKIQSITEASLEQRIEEFPTGGDGNLQSVLNATLTVSEQDFGEILTHYNEKRLTRQTTYFFKKSNQMQGADVSTKILPTVLFFASLVCAITHLGIDYFKGPKILHMDWAENHAIWLIIAAAVLPVLASAIRTYRAASEYTRNKIRFFGQYVRLKEIQDALPNLPNNNLRLTFLWRAEGLLENEHYQWLFLMYDAEWYG